MCAAHLLPDGIVCNQINVALAVAHLLVFQACKTKRRHHQEGWRSCAQVQSAVRMCAVL